jgi:putative methionine-R-sulfoxide reductase with GAF domain
MRFEVFIPAENDEGFDVTLRVEAANWMSALKGGLQKLGSGGTDIRNIVCDIQEDGSVHVTHPPSGRVFRIREMEVTNVASAPKPAATAAPATVPAQSDDGARTMQDLRVPAELLRGAADAGRTVPDLEDDAQRAREIAAERARIAADAQRAEEARRAAETRRAEEARIAAEAQRAEEARRAADARKAAEAKKHADERTRAEAEAARKAEEARKADEARRRVAEQERRVSEAQRKAREASPAAAEADVRVLGETRSAPTNQELRVSAVRRAVAAAEENADDVLARVFEEMMDLELSNAEAAGASELALRLAMRHIDAESGAVLLADIDKDELFFAAAAGPKAKEVKKFRLKMGQGIAGFSAREGVGIAVSDAPRDPRFFRRISDELGYDNRSILCAPMVHDGRTYGCIELINRKTRPSFGGADQAALSYIATHLAEYLAPRVGRDAWLHTKG